jgi:predicted amidohydrolase YtcJ
MLILGAEVSRRGLADVRIEGTAIVEMGALIPREGEAVIDARGGALLPGLHDHHIHLNALAAKAASVSCGPPEVTNADDLAAALARPGTGWLRGVGYHESVMGLPNAAALDGLVADRPVRIQHRSGRMWLLNSVALDLLLARATAPPGLERIDGCFTGRLFDADDWLRAALGSTPPDLTEVSAALARCGVTGVTDMSPANDPTMAAHFAAQLGSGALQQSLVLAGALSLGEAPAGDWRLGPAKLHLHEAALPDFADAEAFVRAAHRAERAIAVHCVSEVELVFTLALFEATGVAVGDRIEHASIAAPGHVAAIAALGLEVCVQPHFVAERGDQYLSDVEPRHRPDLYRLRTLADAGIVLAGGSDGPFGSADPWAAMRAAVSRRTRSGSLIGPDEALTAEAALALFLKDPLDLSREREVIPGTAADLCLLDRPWAEARSRLVSEDVRLCWASGRIVHQRIDKAPGECGASAQPPPR